MTTQSLLFYLSVFCLLAGCTSNKTEASDSSSEQVVDSDRTSVQDSLSSTEFELEKIPIVPSIGDFPYFSAPSSYAYASDEIKEFEEKYFFHGAGQVHPVGGKYFHTKIYPQDSVAFSQTFVVNNYQQAIKKAGGVEIYSGGIPFKATDLVTENKPTYIKDLYDYQSTQYKHFVIRTPEETIWIELNYGSNAELIDFTVLKEEALKESVSTTSN